MGEKIISLKKTARLAGLLYLVPGILAFYSLMYVPGQIIDRNDAITTSKNLLLGEFMFRTSIASHLISVTMLLFLAFTLYKLFKQVNEHQAKLLVTLVAIQLPIVFLLEIFDITSLMILKGLVFKTFTALPLQDLSMLFIKIHGYGIITLEILWGLWLVPFGLLVFKSGFIPRMLGILLILAGVGYIIDSLTFILFPASRGLTQTVAFIFSGVGEGSTILWLLFIGVKDHLSITVISETETKVRSGISVSEYI